ADCSKTPDSRRHPEGPPAPAEPGLPRADRVPAGGRRRGAVARTAWASAAPSLRVLPEHFAQLLGIDGLEQEAVAPGLPRGQPTGVGQASVGPLGRDRGSTRLPILPPSPRTNPPHPVGSRLGRRG